MQVSCPNDDIKIYNLSHGKSLPEVCMLFYKFIEITPIIKLNEY